MATRVICEKNRVTLQTTRESPLRNQKSLQIRKPALKHPQIYPTPNCHILSNVWERRRTSKEHMRGFINLVTVITLTCRQRSADSCFPVLNWLKTVTLVTHSLTFHLQSDFHPQSDFSSPVWLFIPVWLLIQSLTFYPQSDFLSPVWLFIPVWLLSPVWFFIPSLTFHDQSNFSFPGLLFHAFPWYRTLPAPICRLMPFSTLLAGRIWYLSGWVSKV